MVGKRKAPKSGTTKNSKSKIAEEPAAREEEPAAQISEEEPATQISEEEPAVLIIEEEEPAEQIVEEEEPAELQQINAKQASRSSPRSNSGLKSKRQNVEESEEESKFIGEPIDKGEAIRRWPHRYLDKIKGKEGVGSKSNDEKIQAKNHFKRAIVDGRVYFALGDEAYVMAGEGEDNYICRIVEMFEGVDATPYITAQWFYRAKDTVIKTCSNLVDDKRVFLSTIKDDNPLDCLLEKIKIVQLPLNVDLVTKLAALSDADYYYDMMYYVPFSSFLKPQHDNVGDGNESDSTISSETNVPQDEEEDKKVKEMKLLDLFSGCGAMSTGLCLGANMSGVHLVTKWAVDINQYACQSLQLNHPETEVRNEKAEDFLALLKEWKKLCVSFSLIESKDSQQHHTAFTENESDEEDNEDGEDDSETFEVDKILSICYGDPNEIKKSGLYFKIRWKGYGEDEDTWEPIDGLGHCQDKIKKFVTNGYKSKILPLPGDADVICGGPPCQGISGFNRFRNTASPLDDPKNQQLVVYMDIVNYLKPRYVLMENVVDILRFAGGFLARYALGRLVGMNYQARMGLMAAGAYGLPQFRMRMFMWGAHHMEKLPQYPLPTHNVVVRGNTPTEFESNAVAYDEGHGVELEKKLFLGDAISDLPPVENNEARDEMPYGREPETEFQRFIRLKDEIPGFSALGSEQSKTILFDHRPLRLNDDDYQRVCHVPVKKGACFRDLKGVRVRPDNKVEWDPDVERVYLPSGKPLVPDYAMTFVGGTSSKPFGRLWWDETVPTVVTRAEPHNQTITHPEQNRVLTIRENARLQGFPDYYQLCGPIKERYIQVGNAVAVPVARALGFSLGLAAKGSSSEQPLLTLPRKFPNIQDRPSPALDED